MKNRLLSMWWHYYYSLHFKWTLVLILLACVLLFFTTPEFQEWGIHLWEQLTLQAVTFISIIIAAMTYITNNRNRRFDMIVSHFNTLVNSIEQVVIEKKNQASEDFLHAQKDLFRQAFVSVSVINYEFPLIGFLLLKFVSRFQRCLPNQLVDTKDWTPESKENLEHLRRVITTLSFTFCVGEPGRFWRALRLQKYDSIHHYGFDVCDILPRIKLLYRPNAWNDIAHSILSLPPDLNDGKSDLSFLEKMIDRRVEQLLEKVNMKK